jgi:hypothetical protein
MTYIGSPATATEVVEAVSFVIYIHKDRGSNLVIDAEYLVWGFSLFYSVFAANAGFVQ